MADKGNLTESGPAGRSAEEIRRDIAREEENISNTVERIGDRLKETLDWRAYVRDHPYMALGAAAGLGYLVVHNLKPRPSPLERVMRSALGEVRHSVGGMHPRGNERGLLAMTVLGIASKAVGTWMQNATSPQAEACRKAGRPV